MQKIKHKTEVLLAVSVIMTVIFIIFASFFMINTTNALGSEVDKYIDRTVTQKFEIVENNINNDICIVKNFAACLSDYKTFDRNTIVRKISELENSSETIDVFIIADENGDVITSKRIDKNVSTREYFKKAISGEINI